MDKLRAMRFFCRAVELRSFAAAAHTVDVPASAISRAIVTLESELQCTLFNRTTRRLSLTEAGANYYERARQLLADLEDAEENVRSGSAQSVGTLRLGYHPALRLPIAETISAFLQANPEIKIEFTVTNSPTALIDSGLDVVLRIGEVADSSLTAKPLGFTSILMCAAPAYLECHGRPKLPADLREHRAVIPARRDEGQFTRWSLSKGKETAVVEVPVGLMVRDGVGLIDLAIGAAGIAQIYDINAKSIVQQGMLEQLLPDWSSGRQPIYAVLPSRRHVPGKVRAFVAFARRLVRGP